MSRSSALETRGVRSFLKGTKMCEEAMTKARELQTLTEEILDLEGDFRGRGIFTFKKMTDSQAYYNDVKLSYEEVQALALTSIID